MLDDPREANRRFAEHFDLGGLSNQASQRFALVTCMDTRIDPLAILGLRPGEAKILRNAGGRVTEDVLRSLILATTLLNVGSIAVMHHTGCALAGQTEDEMQSLLLSHGNRSANSWKFLAMPDPDAALAEDVQALRACDAFPDSVTVEGWRYDVQSGVVNEIIATN